MYEFVAHLKGSTPTSSGVAHIDACTRTELLKAANTAVRHTQLPLATITYQDTQIWNAQRAERTGSGWDEVMLRACFPVDGLPE